MSQSSLLLPVARITPPTNPSIRWTVLVIVALWFALSFILGARGAFVNRPGAPPFALLAAVLIPIGVFLFSYWTMPSFHDFFLVADLPLVTATQSWRFAGVGFIALSLLGLLPGYFAWPAGLGDMLIGVTAPWVAIALTRNPQFLASKTFVAWNVFGIFDFAVLAVGMGAFAPLIFPSLLHTLTPEMVKAAPMRHLPLSLVPSFFVPIFTIFHLMALFQSQAFSSARG